MTRATVVEDVEVSDLCLLTMPKSLYADIAREAAKRNMSPSVLLAEAVRSYLGGDLGEPVQSEDSSFEFSSPQPTKTRTKLKGFK